MIEDVRTYINSLPLEQQSRLLELRSLVLKNVPEAVEGFAYKMPSYRYKGKPLVYFAAYSKHIGFYGLPNTHLSFKKDLKGFKQGKGSVQFSNNLDLPIELIVKMLVFRMKEIDNLVD